MINVYINKNINKIDVYNWSCSILKKYYNKDIIFKYNKFGKPYLGKFKGFNLSHCGHIAVLAISKNSIGVDIEQLRNKKNLIKSSIYYLLYPDTLKKLIKWTSLEAYYKLLGCGVFNILSLDFKPNTIFKVKILNNLAYNILLYFWKSTYIYTFRFEENYVVSIAYRKLVNNINITIIDVK